MRQIRSFVSDLCFTVAVPLMILAWATGLSLGPLLLWPALGLALAGLALMPTRRRALVVIGVVLTPVFLVGLAVHAFALALWLRDLRVTRVSTQRA